MNEAGLCDCGPPCIPVVPKPVILYLLLWQLVEIIQVVFPHEVKCIVSECQCVVMGPVLPFLSGSVSGLSGACPILRSTARQPQDPKEANAWACVHTADYSNVGFSGHRWESVTFMCKVYIFELTVMKNMTHYLLMLFRQVRMVFLFICLFVFTNG